MSDVGTVVWVAETSSPGGRTVAANGGHTAVLRDAGFEIRRCEPHGIDGELTGRDVDCLVCDAERCPDLVETIRAVRARDEALGVVVFARAGDESLAHRVVATGATEYVPASADGGLVDAVERATERARRMRAVERAERRLDALFEDTPDPVAEYEFVGDDPVIRSVNRTFVETFGYDRETAVGAGLNELIVPSGREDEARSLDERVREGDEINAEIERETTDGCREFLLRNIPVDVADGSDGFAVYIDITEQRERERQLREQNERLNEFASVISHDLRNPMGAVRHRIEMARQTGEEDHLDDAVAALDRMDELLRDLLQMAKQGEQLGETEPLSLGAVARTAWEHVATGDARLSVVDDRTVVADRGRLTQLLENLFINSVDHGTEPDHEDIEVRVGIGDDGCVYVEDDGTGIPPEDRESVFESGFSTATDGTGYGLAIVRQVARAHDWRVTVTASDEGGARFEFRGVAFGES